MGNIKLHIALVGNPNSGKTSLFNSLTGLNQRVGNYPGVTVDKKTGQTRLGKDAARVVDLPGTYSLYPRSEDEWVSYKVLLGQDKETQPNLVVAVVDANTLKRNLLFCSQLIDLHIPTVIALTMVDMATQKGIQINVAALEKELGIPIVVINPRKGEGTDKLKKAIIQTATSQTKPFSTRFIHHTITHTNAIAEVQNVVNGISDYTAIHYLINTECFDLNTAQQNRIREIKKASQFRAAKIQGKEIIERYKRIDDILQKTVTTAVPGQKELFTEKVDKILLHRRWGYLILMTVLFLLFQSIFWLASYPMDWIDQGTAGFSNWLSSLLPQNNWTDLLINGVVAGIGGILIFIPQIAILFGLITILEDTGYMARISFLTDKLMQKVGLSGKSIMPMISGFACAIPAVMSARTIQNKKERLLTILITPLMSCSARLPVYIILIGLVIPQKTIAGFIGLQGLVMLGLYLFGIVMALAIALIGKWLIRSTEKSFFMLELPAYREPRWKNVWQTMLEKAKIFVWQAGKIIFVISIVLWLLSNFGPKEGMRKATNNFEQALAMPNADTALLEKNYTEAKLENSFVGIFGKKIEPVITPLGYDWKIGIALITSFAAREVFVGTMATLYSVENDGQENKPLKEKMQTATFSNGQAVYTVASGVSLMLFYLFAMQCMSTVAIVKRETKSWKWPIVQIVYMTTLAYLMSLLAYQLLK